MKGITDIHCHILYGVDDGSDSIEESIKLLKKEYTQGVENIILTPHFHMGECMPPKSKVLSHFQCLKEQAGKILPQLNLYLGNEIMACNDMVRMLNEGEIFTLADTGYVLVEFYPTVHYEEMLRYVSMLLNGGYSPIIAHVERYQCLTKAFKKINEKNIFHLIEMGAYMQVNASSVYGRNVKFVEKLIEKDFLHFIATDAHGIDYRTVHWNECLDYLQKKYNDDYLKWLLVDNPKKIISEQIL